MEKSYIILVHENPQHLLRLIKALDDNKSYFYIHVDKKVDIQDFKELIADYKNVIFVANRYECIWGSISLVYATLSCMQEVVFDKRNGYCILMSGQDYPVKSREYIDNYLNTNNGYEFVNVNPVESCWSENGCASRFESYSFYLSSKRQDSILIPYLFSKRIFRKNDWKLTIKSIIKSRNIKLISEIIFKVVRKREHPKSIIPYGGSQWWAFSIMTVKKILDFVQDNTSFVKYYNYTAIPDEIFFHTILMHLVSFDKSIKVKDSVTYTNWERKNVPLPVTFSLDDFDELVNLPGDKLFARKFNVNIDEEILAEIDNNILAR